MLFEKIRDIGDEIESIQIIGVLMLHGRLEFSIIISVFKKTRKQLYLMSFVSLSYKNHE
jgi:hypothetical protein